MPDDHDLGLIRDEEAVTAPAGGSRKLVWATGGLAALGAGALLLWLLVLQGGGQPVSVEQAVSVFRAEEAVTTSPLPAGVPVPDSGVYVYETVGSESVDIFLGQEHDYPDETTIAIHRGGCGLTLAWEALDERSTTWELCPGANGWTVARYSEYHRFFGTGEETDYRCDPGSVWLPAEATAGTAWTRRCAAGSTDEAATASVLGSEAVRVGATEVETAHVSLAVEWTGRTRGRGTFDVWLRVPDGLPVRLAWENDNVSKSIAGDVRYTERAELSLASLEPER
ncbi:MAG: hypothetical protein IT201_14780 [Thermoleophilia bacterium]|nr:hypothetical protein [Thermoleophilia bacterium]